MADPVSSTEAWQQIPSQSAGVTDVVTQLQGIVRQLTQLVKVFNGREVFGTITFTSAVNSLTIIQPAVKANSIITLAPTNASAATLMGSAKALYYTIIAGTSFTVLTANGTNTAGTETFSYIINTPT